MKLKLAAAAALLLLTLILYAQAAKDVSEGSFVQVWKCDGSAVQQFAPQSVGPSIVNIVFKQNGMCLDIANFDKSPGAVVWVWQCHPTIKPQNQQWQFNANGTITSMLDGNCLTAANGGTQTYLGASVVVSPCNGGKNQQWQYNSATNSLINGVGYCMDIGSYYRCDDPSSPISNYRYCDWKLPVQDRVRDLVNRLTPMQLASQMGNSAPAIGELGIPAYQWWTECLHGVLTPCGESCPTSFPAASMMGASFNMSMIHEIAMAISTEARALHNQGIGGLDFWAPNININRDPRWGRNQEVPGEDPYMTGQYVTNFMRGLQEGDDPHYVKVVGTCKHYAAYSLENWNGYARYSFNAEVSDYDLVDTYLPAWQACVQDGRARSIMCSYNAVNGVPTCASEFLLQKILRDQFNFDGYVVSDCDAVDCIQENHHYTNNSADTCGVAVKAGCDLNCGDFYQNHMQEALGNGTVSVQELRKSVSRLFKQRFELGMWDPEANQPYTKLPPSVVDSPAHSYLALRAARESIILLKNEANLLPLPKSVKRLAVIGPNANVTDTLLSNYYGSRCLDGTYDCVTTPLNAIKKMLPQTTVNYALGCNITGNSTADFVNAVRALQNSDVGIVFLGLNNDVESEGKDRYNTTLPGMQQQLIQTLYGLGKPIVVVLINGGSVSIEWVKDNIPAILEAGYPGENGAQAIAEVLFGDYNPGGKLTVTVYPSDYVNQVPLTNMSMRAASNNPGRTYRYYTGKPLWEFGYGLSYTTFKTTWISSSSSLSNSLLPDKIEGSEVISFRVRVENTGRTAGDEVVLAFITRNNTINGPLKQLFGFQRIHLVPGESKELFFSSSPTTLAVPAENNKMQRVIYPGSYAIEVGVGEGKLVHPFEVVGKPLFL